MTLEKITFIQTFPTGQFANQKLGVELTANEWDFKTINGDGTITLHNPDEVANHLFSEAKRIVNEAFNAMNPQERGSYGSCSAVPGSPMVYHPPEQKTSEENTVELLIKDLNACTELSKKNNLNVEVGLYSYYDLALKYPKLMEAYEVKKSELVAKESKQILDATEAFINKAKNKNTPL